MVSLLDIAPLSDTVPVGDDTVEVYGISAAGIARLLKRYPDILQTVQEKGLNFPILLETAPDAVAAIIAMGSGNEGNKKAEEIASRLPVGTQVEFLSAIAKMTMPGGLGPFVEKLEGLTEIIAGESKGENHSEAPLTNLQEQSTS